MVLELRTLPQGIKKLAYIENMLWFRAAMPKPFCLWTPFGFEK